jgi:hypothetical protein
MPLAARGAGAARGLDWGSFSVRFVTKKPHFFQAIGGEIRFVSHILSESVRAVHDVLVVTGPFIRIYSTEARRGRKERRPNAGKLADCFP